MRSSSSVAAVALALSLTATAAHATGARNYAVDGAYDVAVSTFDASTQLVTPTTGSGPWPLLVASHGWSASGKNQIGWAKHFASYGFVVAVPTFPNAFSPDTTTNVGIIVDLVTKLTGAQASAHHVAAGAFGLEGHSAGGLATTVAASTLHPAATVLFDPVDKNGDGKTAYAKLCEPVLAIFAESSSCNQNAEWLGFDASTKAELVAFKVANSTHCDGENEPRGLCGPFCGGAADPDRQAAYAHYATAFFLAKVKGDVLAASALADATVQADSDLTGALHAASQCTTTTQPDAGTTTSPTPTSTGTSSSTPPPASSGNGNSGDAKNGAARNGSSASTNEGTAASDAGGGSGCNVAPGGAGSFAFTLLALSSLLVRRRKR